MQRRLWRWAALALPFGCGSDRAAGYPADATVDATSAPDAAASDSGPSGDSAVEGSASDASTQDGAMADTGAAEAGPSCGDHCGDVLTWHNQNTRLGQNLYETILTPNNVDVDHFGRLFTLPVDGFVDAQPLYMSAVEVAGKGRHDVLFVATEHATLYAFDAESNEGANAEPLWQVSLLGAGETTADLSAGGRACAQISPEIGITSTPVIDPSRQTIFVVAMSKTGGSYIQRLHAIDVTSGAERPGSPVVVQASAPGTGPNSEGGVITFLPRMYKERAGLLLDGGRLYLTWASHCDLQPYNGWVMAYDPVTLEQTALLNVTPNGIEGSNWGSGAAPAADGLGNIYFLDANGTFDTTLDSRGFPSKLDFGNAMLRISTAGGELAVADYFATYNTVAQSTQDIDFGSGGALLLPDEVGSAAHPHLVVGAGKDGNIYLVDRDDMGKWNGVDGGADNSQIVEELPDATPGRIFSSPAYFDHALYFGDIGGTLKRFAMADGHITATPTSRSTYAYPSGVTPSVSANGGAPDPGSTAIVWAVDTPWAATTVLHAYAAGDLSHELYNATQADGGRDAVPLSANKFIVPTVANGHVYVGTQSSVLVFGLL
jgi:hypothetical protein